MDTPDYSNYSKTGYLTHQGFFELYNALAQKLGVTKFRAKDFGKGKAGSPGLINEHYQQDPAVQGFIEAYQQQGGSKRLLNLGNQLYQLRRAFMPGNNLLGQEACTVKLFTALCLFQLTHPGITLSELEERGLWKWNPTTAPPARRDAGVAGLDREEAPDGGFYYYIGFYLSILSGEVRYLKLAISQYCQPKGFVVKERGLHNIADREENPGYYGHAQRSPDGYFFASLSGGDTGYHQMNMIWKNQTASPQEFGEVPYFRATMQGVSSDGGRLLCLEALFLRVSREEREKMKDPGFDPKNLSLFAGNGFYDQLCFYLSLQHRIFAASAKPIENLAALSAKDNILYQLNDLTGSYRLLYRHRGLYFQARVDINNRGQVLLHTHVRQRKKYLPDKFLCALVVGSPRNSVLCTVAFQRNSLNTFGFLSIEFDQEVTDDCFQASLLLNGMDADGSVLQRAVAIKDDGDFGALQVDGFDDLPTEDKLARLYKALVILEGKQH